MSEDRRLEAVKESEGQGVLQVSKPKKLRQTHTMAWDPRVGKETPLPPVS